MELKVQRRSNGVEVTDSDTGHSVTFSDADLALDAPPDSTVTGGDQLSDEERATFLSEAWHTARRMDEAGDIPE